METFRFIDIYATKGIEYLVVIAFLIVQVFFFKFIVTNRKSEERRPHLLVGKEPWKKAHHG